MKELLSLRPGRELQDMFEELLLDWRIFDLQFP